MLDKWSALTYIFAPMGEQEKKVLEEQVAKAMVKAVLAISPRLDTFSTWLMGITTGFLVILFTNIERTMSVIKVGPTKALIVLLAISTMIGLFQKFLALQLQIQTDMAEAQDRKMREVISSYSGESVADPYRFFRDNADTAHMLLLFFSAFPKWLQKRFLEKALAKPKLDLSDRQKETKKLLWQYGAIVSQIFCALLTVVIVLINL